MAKEKKRKFPVKTTGVALVAAFLLSWFHGWIPGIGSGKELINRQSPTAVQTTIGETTPVTDPAEGIDTYRITVKKDKIMVDGKEVSEKELVSILKEWTPNSKVEVIEEDAIKDTYDSVIKLLDEHKFEH